MNRKRNKCFFPCLYFYHIYCTFTFVLVPHYFCLQQATELHPSPSPIRQLRSSFRSQHGIEYYSNYKIKSKEPSSTITVENYFQIEPSDATDVAKYSQPAIDKQLSNPWIKVPSITPFIDKFSVPSENPSHVIVSEELQPPTTETKKGVRYLDHNNNRNLQEKSIWESEYNLGDMPQGDMPSDSLYLKPQNRNNFTDSAAQLISVSSETVLSYESNAHRYATPVKKNEEDTHEERSSHLNSKLSYSDANFSTSPPKLSSEFPSVSTSIYIEFINHTDSVETTFTTIVLPSMSDLENISSSSPSLDSDHRKLSSGTVAGIVIGVLVCVTIMSSAVIYLLYRRYNGKCTSVVESKFNSDNCGYLDDSLRSSIYLNNHIELPKESSEEMSSLDNDSFLNSLETMTIQNYWADNSKNTKV